MRPRPRTKRGTRRTFAVTDHTRGGNVVAWLDRADFERVERIAIEENVSRSEVLRRALRQFLEARP